MTNQLAFRFVLNQTNVYKRAIFRPSICISSRGFKSGSKDSYASVQAGVPPVDYDAKPFNKILIANRGEIACRVIRTARKMGIQTVAVHSTADTHSLHVQMADEAYLVGPPPTSQSYLSIPNIIAAVHATGAEAVHPGYGFLSENSHFVKALDDAGITFIGPNEKAMAAMGDKIASKILAKSAGVHTIPGFNGTVESTDHALSIVKEIGYPVMIKASAGGGGKGMRIAWSDAELLEGYKLAKQESLSSFGDDRLLIERYVDNPRHIEIQVLGDNHGTVLWLPERECSIQRRNQKVIEEAPSVHLDQATRRAMGEQAVQLAKAVNYNSAGTVEFLVDPKRNFFFLEMNTRLQVEHPITEMITGQDLVEHMIRSAANQPLRLTQEEVSHPKGWAMESRVYAEDPEKYLPSIGRLQKYIEPVGENVRCDSGIIEGSEISIYYDPMICKLATYGPDRHTAQERMNKALDEYVIKGVTHNIPLLRSVMSHPRFTAGNISTKFLAEEYPGGFKGAKLNEVEKDKLAVVAAMTWFRREERNWLGGEVTGVQGQLFQEERKVFVKLPGVEGAHEGVEVSVRKLDTTEDGDIFEVSTPTLPPVALLQFWPVESHIIKTYFPDSPEKPELPEDDEISLTETTIQYLDPLPLGFRLQYLGSKFDVTVLTPEQHTMSKYMLEKPKQDLARFLVSPMPGSIVSIAVKPGDMVTEGGELAVVEAMKMQNVLRASRVGKVKDVKVKPGQGVAADDIIIEFEEEKKI